MLERILRRDPGALRVATDGSVINTERVHEGFELIDSALDTFAGRIIRIGLPEAADAIGSVDLKLGRQSRHQLAEAGFAGRARPTARAKHDRWPVVAELAIARANSSRHNRARSQNRISH